MSPEQVLRTYFHAKDENRPFLLADVFSPDAQLEIRNRSDQISFPATTIGLEGIADALVRRFNQAYENIYSFYMDRPGPNDESFSCDWLVGMTDKESRSVRVRCGHYDWTFRSGPDLLATRLILTIETMIVLGASRTASVMGWLKQLAYPWSSAAEVIRTLPLGELGVVSEYLGHRGMRTNRA
ncbi:MAG: hypothetical protein JSW31_12300 [Burkholderiales bacterium]|nr:MAG: hypothetical protein JSW31_12300 [Burkholderiales bacterium]